MVKVGGHINEAHYKMTLSNGRHELIADEPITNGGTDLGFAPTELLCSALGACTCATLRMYADRKKWNLHEVKAHISFESNAEKNGSKIRRDIELIGDLSPEQRERLLDVANHCPIHKILSSPIAITSFLQA
jgi:putative redox protein